MGNSHGVEVLNCLSNALDELSDIVEGQKSPQVLFEIFFKIPLGAKLEDQIVVVGSGQSLMEFDDVRVLDVLDDQNLLLNHLTLLLAHALHLDHFDGVSLELTLLAALKDLAGSPSPYLPYELVVSDFF